MLHEKTVIVFNGEIYNYVELRRELEARGYVFRTRSDTEVIPAAIAAWGIELGLRRLRGMFALLCMTPALAVCCWRATALASNLSIGPLISGGLLLRLWKALLTPSLVSHRVNPIAVHDYLAQGYPTTPATCWADIRMLEPGTWLGGWSQWYTDRKILAMAPP